MARTGGLPVCVALFLCDKVIIGNDLTATVVRIIDTVGVPPDKKRKPGDKMVVGGVSVFISIKNGESDGDFSLFLECLDPKQKRTRIGRIAYATKGEPHRGGNTVAPFAVRWAGEGVYWYELTTADGSLLGRSPFKLIVGTPSEVQEKLQAEADDVAKIQQSLDKQNEIPA